MTSLFQYLQSRHAKITGIDMPAGLEINQDSLLKMVRSYPGDSFSIYAMNVPAFEQLVAAEYQFMASLGVSSDDLTRSEDVEAADELFVSLRLKSEFLKAKRLGFELISADGRSVQGIAIRAESRFPIKSLFEADHLALTVYDADVDDKGNVCNAKVMPTIFVLKPKEFLGEKPVTDGSSVLFLDCEFAPDTGSGASANAIFLNAAQQVGRKTPRTLPKELKVQQSDAIINRFLASLFLFHVLGREPSWIERKVTPAAVGVPRIKGTTPSNVNHILIDPVEYARMLSRKAIEIQEAMESTGGYKVEGLDKVEGLVLVRAYVTADGKTIDAHARCADKVVRDEVKRLLNQVPVNYREIAEYVEAFGAARTKLNVNGPTPVNKISVLDPERHSPHVIPARNPAPEDKT